MALVNCKECSTEVSDQAYKCPSCGALLRKLKRSPAGQVFKWLFIIWNVLMVIWLVAHIYGASQIEVSNVWEATGLAIGARLGTYKIIAYWVVGDIILGIFTLLTRPKTV